MHGLCDDDFGMELLVAGKIVSLDLTVGEVFEHVWRTAVESGVNGGVNGNVNGGVNADPRAAATRIRGRHRLVDDDDDDDDDEDDQYDAGDRDVLGSDRSHAACPPMVVTYRLQGLDGEATETMVSEIDADAAAETDPEVTFAICATLRTHRGLDALLSLVPLLSSSEASNSKGANTYGQVDSRSLTTPSSETASTLMRLLNAAAELAENRRAMLAARALPTLLAEAGRLFGTDTDAAEETGNELLLLVERLLTEETAMGEDTDHTSPPNASPPNANTTATPNAIALAPGGLTRSFSRGALGGNNKQSCKVRKVRRRDPEPSPWKSSVATTPPTSRDRLRFSSSSSPSSRRAAAGERKVPRREPRRHWRGYYRGSPRATPTPRGRSPRTSRRPWPGFATSTHSRRGYLARRRLALELRCCALVVEGIPGDGDASGTRLKSALHEKGATRAVTGYLLDVAFSAPGARDLDKASDAWVDACARPALPHALATLSGLIRSHPEGIEYVAGCSSGCDTGSDSGSGMLRLLHALEPVTEHGVGTLSENALQCIEQMDADAAETIAALRRATKATQMQKAMERREKMLKEMGLTRLSPASPSMGGESMSPGSPAMSPSPGSYSMGAYR